MGVAHTAVCRRGDELSFGKESEKTNNEKAKDHVFVDEAPV